MTPKRRRGRRALSDQSPTARLTVRLPRALADAAAKHGVDSARIRELIVADLGPRAPVAIEPAEPERPALLIAHALVPSEPFDWACDLTAPVSVTHSLGMTEPDLRRWYAAANTRQEVAPC